MTESTSRLYGVGIYSLQEASHLVGISAGQLRRWLCGYERDGVRYPPLWSTDIPATEVIQISFSDLMEARILAQFYKEGLQIQTARRAIDLAIEKYKLVRPFSSKKFQTDGRQIFLELEAQFPEGESGYIEILNAQRVFTSIVKPSFKDIDFEGQIPSRWWPLGRKRCVVVDPNRSMGRPVCDESGIPVFALVASFNKAADQRKEITRVAKMFGSKPKCVKDAVEFQMMYAA